MNTKVYKRHRTVMPPVSGMEARVTSQDKQRTMSCARQGCCPGGRYRVGGLRHPPTTSLPASVPLYLLLLAPLLHLAAGSDVIRIGKTILDFNQSCSTCTNPSLNTCICFDTNLISVYLNYNFNLVTFFKCLKSCYMRS